MATFKAMGVEWLVSLDGPKVKAVRQECRGDDDRPVNLTAEFLEIRPLLDNPVLLPEVMWVLCRDQATQKNISREAFVGAVIGDTCFDAARALIDAIVDFIPSPQKRSLLRAAIKADLEAESLAIQISTTRTTDSKLEEARKRKIEAAVNEIFDAATTQLSSATDSPDTSAPAPTA